MSLDEKATASNDSAGVVAPACMEEKVVGTREAPTARGRGSQLELREEQAGPCGVADRIVLLMKPGIQRPLIAQETMAFDLVTTS